MPSREREHQPENEQPAYFKCAQFIESRLAGQVYADLQRAIFESDNGLSCFRLQFNRTWHTAVLGNPPPPKLAAQIESLLSKGEAAALPPDVVTHLRGRRAQAVASGSSWIERHYRPGQDR